MSMCMRGDHLGPALRAEVLRRYVHRGTHENARQTYGGKCPKCAQATDPRTGLIITGDGRKGRPPLKRWTVAEWHKYHVPLISDAEWLKQHGFYVTKAGVLDARRKRAEYLGNAREVDSWQSVR